MKITKKGITAILALWLASAALSQSLAQAFDPPIPGDLQPISSIDSLPDSAVFYGISDYPDMPPLPVGVALYQPGTALYWSPSANAVFADDREVTLGRMLLRAAQDSGIPGFDDGGGEGDGGGGTQITYSGIPFDTNGLWMEIAMTNGTLYGSLAAITLHNTTNGSFYELLSKESLTLTNWWSEGFFQAGNQDLSQTFASVDTRSSLFLWAHDLPGGTAGLLPIWWQLAQFGQTGLDPASDPAGTGSTLLANYQSGNEPNPIQFSVSVTNFYSSPSLVPAQLSVTAGVPYYQAVLVDSTNFQSATWSAYTPTGITADLGSNEGWHEVWFGLKGFSPTAWPTWVPLRLKFGHTAPQLTLTSPTNSVLTQTIIQLIGYCPEALSSISYDITNADGVLSNQQVFILDQHLDRSTFELTTNIFQAFDIELITNGPNLITLHATDLAGNTSDSTYSFTVDFSSQTNPPPLQVTWPRDGAEIAASIFNIDGFTADPSAKITAQFLSTNGSVCTTRGLVERNGKFWVEKIPLYDGTNSFTLTVTDSAGNTATTNFTLLKSDLLLTIDPITPKTLLWRPALNVTGQISDPTFAVWVNGVKGTNNADGTWSAKNVPVTPGGTASWDIIAYEPSDQQPDGSYGN